MEIKDRIFDNRIDSLNLLIEIDVKSYHQLSKDILDKNEFQRRRVKSSSSVYSLLKTDIKLGCVIPPIVLALAMEAKPKKEEPDNKLIEIINSNKDKLIILDGLQRTYTIRDLINEMVDSSDPELENVYKHKIRIEIYVGINKLGILYRMLTLNTGQTPMSTRHQIEIIYSDYIKGGIEGIRLLKEVDFDSPENIGEYKFRDIIEGFTSYLDRDYLTIDRVDILDNIKSLEKLSTENQNKDLFIEFLSAYDKFVKKMYEISRDWYYNNSYSLTSQPFGNSALKIFNKSQVMTGFGSALGKLLDFEVINQVSDVVSLIDKIEIRDIHEDLNQLIIKLDNIRTVAKKIGNDQRLFFHHFFRELFDSKSDGYLNIGKSVQEAYNQYQRKTQ